MGEALSKRPDRLESPGRTPDLSLLNTPELVLALCAPIGSPVHEVAGQLKEALEDDFEYEVQIIKLSDFIRSNASKVSANLPDPIGGDFDSKKSLITAGNDLREKFGCSVLADLAIHQIATTRDDTPERKTRPRRQCFIIDSIKNKEELNQLRKTYADIFFFVGVFSPLEKRVEKLSESMDHANVHRLIDQDSGEEIDSGQTVRDVFPESDYFLRIDSATDAVVESKVRRFLDVIFGTKLVTPTADETAMYQAASAAGNSACLSRQVGASITDDRGELVSVGWNDVPRYGGGVYRNSAESGGAANDQRCWNLEGGVCFNDKEKDLLAELVVGGLVSDGIIGPESKEKAYKNVRGSERLGKLLEFSRSIHAEMHAILSAAKSGSSSIVGGSLYATTYPCHSCARHIIASGISKVFYIEPYRKSLAVKIHKDAITESEHSQEKVRILMYEGVAPRKYLSLYRVPSGASRKENGKLVKKHPKSALPVITSTLESIPVLESLTVQKLRKLDLVS